MTAHEHDHWLARPAHHPASVDRLRRHPGAASCSPTSSFEHHPHFGLDGTFGFGAWFGFAACVVLMLFAKALGAILKRPDTYYDD